MTHVTRAHAEKLGPNYENICKRAEHVTAAAAEAYPPLAKKIAGIKAQLTAIDAANTAAVHASEERGLAVQSDIERCKQRTTHCELQLEQLAMKRVNLCRDYSIGAVTDLKFDKEEAAAETIRRRLEGLREGLMTLNADAMAARPVRHDGGRGRLLEEFNSALADASIEIAKGMDK